MDVQLESHQRISCYGKVTLRRRTIKLSSRGRLQRLNVARNQNGSPSLLQRLFSGDFGIKVPFLRKRSGTHSTLENPILDDVDATDKVVERFCRMQSLTPPRPNA